MSNSYARELLRQYDHRFDIDSGNMTMGQYLMQNTKLKGKPFSFDRYPFQKELANDWHRRSSVDVKPSQVGVSEIYQRVALAMIARNRHRKIIYAYPDDMMRKKNYQTRVEPLVSSTKAFSAPEGQRWVSSIELTEINGSFLFMTGSKASDTVSTDADAIFLDEYDLHPMDQAALFSSRLQNSDWKIAKYFSTPTYTNFGVSGLFENSDQHYYDIRCDHCNHWQFPMFTPNFIVMPGLPPDWPDLKELTIDTLDRYRIDLQNSYVCCEKCRKPLDLGREDNRNWVAKYPSRQNMRGRKVNPFSVSTRPVIDIVSELLTYRQNDYLRGFSNSVLGEPEDSGNARISEALIDAALKGGSTPTIDRQQPTWLGCDMGHTCHLVVGQGPNEKNLKTVIMEQVPLGRIRERIQEVQSLFNLVGGMVDRHPESQVAEDIWEATNGVVVPGEYRGDKEMNLIMVPGSPDKVHYVQINRTIHLDQVPRDLRNGTIIYEGYGLLGPEIKSQLRNMIRIEKPEVPATWEKLNPNDHFFHALAFMRSACKLKPYIDLKVGLPKTELGFAGVAMVGYSGIANLNTASNHPWRASNRLPGLY